MSGRNITFPYDRNKATQAILWLLHRNGGAMDKVKLVKLFYFADWNHLIRYGRPIVGGKYYAMKLGPASSELLNHIEETTSDFAMEQYRVLAKTIANEELLSESDIEILDEVYDKYHSCDSWKLVDITHHFKAWDKNYPDKDANTSYLLPYEDFFLDTEDKSMLDIIREDQEARDLLMD